MRVLLITHFFGASRVGGTEVLTLGLARSLQRAGHEVHVLCADDWETAPDYRPTVTEECVEGIKVRRLHFNWTKAPDVFRYLYDNPEVAAHLTEYLRALQPHIVHVTSCYTLSASVIAAARRHGAPTILTATDFWFLCARNTLLQDEGTLCSGPEGAWKCARCNLARARIYRWPRAVLPERVVSAALQKLGGISLLTRQRGLRGMHGDWAARTAHTLQAIDQVDLVVTASRFLEDLFTRYGVSRDKIRFSPYGLDTSWARGFTAKTGSDRLRLGFIGQLIPMKGPDLLIRAFRSLPADTPMTLRIFGDLAKSPEYGGTLRALAAGDPRIDFAGTFDNTRMGEILSGLDALVVPSIWYDFPLVIPSAFATRTPVVATDLPGMNEQVAHDVNGLLFARHDWQDLARQIRRLVEDPGLLDALRAGIGRVKTTEEMAEEYEDLYVRYRSA